MRALAQVSFFLILVNCSSLSKNQFLPPEDLKPIYRQQMSHLEKTEAIETVNKFLKDHSSDREQKWGQYTLGLLYQSSEPKLSCQYFRNLSEHSHFVLSDLARLRALSVCELTPEESPLVLKDLRLHKTPWTKDLVTDLGISISEKMKNGRDHIFFLREKSKQALTPNEKVSPILKAIEIAKAFDDRETLTDLESRLFHLSPRFRTHPEKKELLAAAHDHRRARQFELARNLYMKVFIDNTLSVEERINALKGVRQSYKQESKREEFIRISRDIVDFTRAFTRRHKNGLRYQKLHLEARLALVRTLWTAGSTNEAESLIREIISHSKKKLNVSEALWLLGRISEEKGDYAEALRLNGLALRKEKIGSNLWEKLYWQKAWNHRKLKELGLSITSFLQLIEGAPKSDSRFKYEFWLAKTLKEDKQLDESQLILRKLISADLFGYYGIMSRRELGEKLPPLISSRNQLLEKPEHVSESDFGLAKWLHSVGETEVLRKYLPHKFINTNISKMNPVDQGRLFSWIYEAQDFARLFYLVSSGSNKERILNENPEFLFPRPWLKEIEEASDQTGISKELLYSIMRQESAFDPYARSPVDAFGLLQLTLFTAEKVAREKGLALASHEELFRPQLNIPLGANFMRYLMRKFENQMLLSIASYNASEDAVTSWLKTRYKGDPLEFIEDIPYSETMSYIKSVLRNFVFYSRLNSEGNEIAFPEFCLDGLQSIKTSSL